MSVSFVSVSFDRTADLLAGEAGDWLSAMLKRGDRFADLFAESSYAERFSLTNERSGPVFDVQRNTTRGVGLRAAGERATRFTSVDEFDPGSVLDAARELGDVTGSRPRMSIGELVDHTDLPSDVPDAVSEDEKRALLQEAADAAMSLEPDLTGLEVTYQGRVRRFVVASTDGRFVRSATSSVGLRVRASLHHASAHSIVGGSGGLGVFFEQSPSSAAAECIERLNAVAAAKPARFQAEMPIVLAAGWGGVWLHEVVGHLLEVDTAVQGPYRPSRIGRQVAPEFVSIYDDATLDSVRGTFPVDDEGSPGDRTVLVENGILRTLLTDRINAARFDLPETGNGRRQDYRFEPLPRMSNLELAAGSASPADLVSSVGRGLFVKMIGHGSVRPADDAFSFDVLEGYLIENGRIGAPVSGLRISGRPSAMLSRIAGLGDDVRFDRGRGMCVKQKQTVPVSVGVPSVLLHDISVEPVAPE